MSRVPPVVAVVLAVVGCGDAGRREVRSETVDARAVVGGDVISTVDGAPITLQEVREAVQATGLPPREALLRLQSERLLMAEAERLGFGDLRTVEKVADKALVQALIDEEAAKVEATPEDVERAYRSDITRFVRPERRISVHVVAQPSPDDPEADQRARAYIQQLRSQLAAAPDPLKLLDEAEVPEGHGYSLKAERLPPIDARGAYEMPPGPLGIPQRGVMDSAYTRAVFSIPGTGVPEPVRSAFGWHAIVVTEVLAPVDKSVDEVAEVLRPGILTRKRREHMETLYARLKNRWPVREDQSVLEAAIADDE